MLTTLADFLISQGDLDAQAKADFLSQNSHCQTPKKILQMINTLDQSLKEKIMNHQQARKILFPELHYTVMIDFIANIFGGYDQISEEELKIIEELIRNHAPDLTLILNKINENLQLGIENEIEDYVKGCKGKLIETITSEFDSLQELNRTPVEDVNGIPQTQEKLIQQKEQLKEDIQTIPNYLDDYKLRKIEIDLISRILQGNTQPELSPEDKQYLENINVVHPEAEIARNVVLNERINILNNIRVFRKKHCGLDFFLIQRILKQGRRIKQETLSLIKNGKKIKVIFFMGLTGSGKTTIISKMVGLSLEKKMIQGISTIQPSDTNTIPEQYKDLVIGYSNSSMTLYPRIFKIPKQHLSEEDANEFDAVFGMDSAGFDDTNGLQVEIANRIAIMEILRSISNIHIAIVLNGKSLGARYKGLETLASTTVSIISKLTKIKESIFFIFNNFDDSQMNDLHANIVDKESKLQNSGTNVIDKDLKYFFTLLKKQTSNPKKILRFYPLEGSPADFYEKLSSDKEVITNMSQHSCNTIGANLKEAIKEVSDKYMIAFQQQFKNGRLEGAQFYLKMLKYIASQRKMDTASDELIEEMKNGIEKKIKTKISKFDKSLQQYETSYFTNDQKKHYWLRQLKSEHDNLQTQIDKFSQIYQSDLCQVFQHNLEKFLQEYQKKFEYWDDPNIIQIYKNGLALFHMFSPREEEKTVRELNQKKSQLHNQIIKDMKNFEKENTIIKNWNEYKAAIRILGEELNTKHFTDIIDEIFIQLKNKCLVDIDSNNEIPEIINKYEGQKPTQQFLKFLYLIPNYPIEIASDYIKSFKMKFDLIVIHTPKKLLDKFNQMLKKSLESDDDDDLQFEEQQKKNDSTNIVIEMRSIIESLKLLNKVPWIKDYQQNKIEDHYNYLVEMIKKQLRKIENLREAFMNKKFEQIHKRMRKSKKQLVQLENLVEILEIPELMDQFKQLKEQLCDEIFSFINKFDYSESISFKGKNALIKALEKLEKIKEFGFVHKMLGSNNQLKRKIEETKKNITSAIKLPIDNYQHELKKNENKMFQPAKFSNFISYIQQLQNENLNYTDFQTMKAIREKQDSINKLVDDLKIQLIITPLQDFLKIINVIGIQDDQIEDLSTKIMSPQTEKFRKAWKLLFEVMKYEKIEFKFDEMAELKKQITDSFQYLKNNITMRMDKSQTPINLISKLRMIVIKLKAIEDSVALDEKYFEGVLNNINDRIYTSGKNAKDIKEAVLKNEDDIDQFNAQKFIEAYQKLTEDHGQVGKQDRQLLKKYLKSYPSKVIKKLENLKMDMYLEGNLARSISLFLKYLKTYHMNSQLICSKIEEIQHQQLPDFQLHREFLQGKVMSYYESVKQEIVELKGQKLKNKLEVLAHIQYQIRYIKDTWKIKFEKIEKQIQNSPYSSLFEILQKKKDELIEKKNKFIKNSNFQLININRQFYEIYLCSSQKERQDILENIEEQFKKNIQILKDYKFTAKYDQFEEKKGEMRNVINHLPRNLSKKWAIQVEKAVREVEESQQQIIENMKKGSINKILEYAKQVQKHDEKLRELIEILTEKKLENQDLKGRECLQRIQSDIWNNRTLIEQQSSNVKKIMEQMEINFLKKMQSAFQNIKDYVLSQFQKKTQKASDILTMQQSSNSEILSLTENYEFILKILSVVDKGRTELISDSDAIIDDFLTIKQHFIQDFTEKVEKNFRQIQDIDKDPIGHRNIIENTLININIYQQIKKQINKLLGKDHHATKNIARIISTYDKIVQSTEQFKYKQLNLFDPQIIGQNQQQLEERILNMEYETQCFFILNKYLGEYHQGYNQIENETLLEKRQYEIQEAVNKFKNEIVNSLSVENENFLNSQAVGTMKLIEKIYKMPSCKFLISSQNEPFIKFKDMLLGFLQQKKIQCLGIIDEIAQIESYRMEVQKEREQQLKIFRQRSHEQSKQLNNRLKNAKAKPEKDKIMNLLKKSKIQDQRQVQVITHRFNQKMQQKKGMAIHGQENLFLTLKEALFNICQMIDIYHDKAIEIINNVSKKMTLNPALVTKFYNSAIESKSPLAPKVIGSMQIFNQIGQPIRNLAIKSQNDILNEMIRNKNLTREQEQKIEDYSQKFTIEYKKYADKCKLKGRKVVIDEIKTSISQDKKLIENIYQEITENQFGQTERVHLLVKIFFLWQLASPQKNKLILPTPAQIICCLLLIGIDDCHERYPVKTQRLAEVPAGEGKTIMIGVIGVYLAIFGFEVHCICQQSVLKQKGQRIFQELFSLCKVSKSIKYGTCQEIMNLNLKLYDEDSKKYLSLEEYFSKMLIKENQSMIQDIFNWIKDIVKRPQNKVTSKRILLIDEISTFFSQKYYGKTMSKTISLKGTSIEELFKYIWDNRKKITIDEVKNSKYFQAITAKYSYLESILVNQLYGIFQALNTYQDYKYSIQQGKIVYKTANQNQNQTYGYSTIFAYFHEFGKNKNSINSRAKSQIISIDLCVGEFAYACLFQFYFKAIGVGTLIPRKMKTQLVNAFDFSASDIFSIPSAYIQTNRQIWSKRVVNQGQHYKKIIESFQQEFKNGRPILIFFKNIAQMLQFAHNPQFSKFEQCSTLIKDTNQDRFEEDIKQSGYKNRITLLPNNLLKSIDFQIFDQNVLELGGYHAIVTYCLESHVDDALIKGKIGRKGEPGSLVQVVTQTSVLEQKSSMEQMNNEIFESSLQKHEDTMRMLRSPNFSKQLLLDYIIKKNAYEQYKRGSKKCRTILAIDGTKSMDLFFEKLKIFLSNVFKEIYEVRNKKKLQSMLEIKIIIYRNYNSSYDDILESTGFESDPRQLIAFLKSVEAKEGWQNEALEVSLQQVNRLDNIDQIFIFSDVCGNNQMEIKQKRNAEKYRKLENVRKGKKMILTTVEKELKELRQKSVKVNALYLKDTPQLKEYYEKMAEKTEGEACYIDIQNYNATYTMKQFIVQKITNNMANKK